MIELHHPAWFFVPDHGKFASFVRPPKYMPDPTDLLGSIVLIDGHEYDVQRVEIFAIASNSLPYELPYGLLVTAR